MPDYDTVQNLEYLEMVTCEALRLYPPAFRYEECDAISVPDTGHVVLIL